ncbi:MAG: glutaredoxin family protein [Acidimicrobiia bacterium]|nr:glutaredoxin family protein [Acidimicrobiia bacterium]
MTDRTAEPILFFTRRGCPLCDKALALLQPVADRYGLTVDEVDVDLDLALLERYDHRVPVIMYAGKVVAEGIVTADDLDGGFVR